MDDITQRREGPMFESLRVSCDDNLDETTKALKKALS
jgi:hypothetical protein